MDDNRLYKYYRPSGFGWNSLVYNYLMTDRYFRTLFNFGPYCTAMTVITCILFALIITYTVTSWVIFLSNTKKFAELREDAERMLPRKESVLEVRPAFNCISKHLQQANVFLDKTKKVLRKEQLEVEIMNSRINSMSELLKPGEQSQWCCSQSPKGYFRDINTPLKK